MSDTWVHFQQPQRNFRLKLSSSRTGSSVHFFKHRTVTVSGKKAEAT